MKDRSSRAPAAALLALTAVLVAPGPAVAQEDDSTTGPEEPPGGGSEGRIGGIDNHPPPPFGDAPLGAGVVFSPGWSVEAFWIGIGAAAGVLGAGIAAVAVAGSNDPPDGAATALGVTSMALLGVGAATVALGGASARGHPYVPGARGVRIAAWTVGALSLGSGIALVASDLEGDEARRAAFLAPVILGAVSLVLFAIDALVSALQTSLVSGGG